MAGIKDMSTNEALKILHLLTADTPQRVSEANCQSLPLRFNLGGKISRQEAQACLLTLRKQKKVGDMLIKRLNDLLTLEEHDDILV